jgi:hypothetical protein
MAFMMNYACQQFFLEAKDGTGVIPTTYYIALMKTSPALDGTGGVEVDSAVNTWYARQAVTWAAPSLSGRNMANSVAVTHAASAASAISGNIVSLVAFDALTSGNAWFLMPLTTQLSVGLASLVQFPIGQIVLEFTTA